MLHIEENSRAFPRFCLYFSNSRVFPVLKDMMAKFKDSRISRCCENHAGLTPVASQLWLSHVVDIEASQPLFLSTWLGCFNFTRCVMSPRKCAWWVMSYISWSMRWALKIQQWCRLGPEKSAVMRTGTFSFSVMRTSDPPSGGLNEPSTCSNRTNIKARCGGWHRGPNILHIKNFGDNISHIEKFSANIFYIKFFVHISHIEFSRKIFGYLLGKL